MLGLVYRSTYALGHDLIVYNLAIKLPVIAANVGLAYLVAAALAGLGAGRAVAGKAWAFLLLNPFLLYVGAAWGQIDAIAAVLAVAASSPSLLPSCSPSSCIKQDDPPARRRATRPSSSSA